MEISAWTIYWITRCDAIRVMAFIFSVASGLVALIWVPACCDLACRVKALVVGEIVFVTTFVLSLGTAVLIPSTEQMAAIIVIPRIANSHEVKDLGTGIVELAKEWIVELKPKKVEK